MLSYLIFQISGIRFLDILRQITKERESRIMRWQLRNIFNLDVFILN
jgi:hypothetical protein